MKWFVLSLMCGMAVATACMEERLAVLKEIEGTPGVLWQAGISERFANKSMKPQLGVTKKGMEERRKFAAEHVGLSKDLLLPASFDSEENWPHCAKVIGDIRDQSNCGCCWAFAAASAASDRLCISTNAALLEPLSAQDVCFCASSDGCDGGDISTPWRHMKFGGWFGGPGVVTGGQYQGTGPFGKGFCSDFSLPHCHHHGPQGNDPYPAENAPGCPSATSPSCPASCDSTASDSHANFDEDKLGFNGNMLSVSGEEQIAQAIKEGGPVETAFTVYADFANYVSGIYHHVTGNEMGGHAVRIVGWGEENGQKYWKVANSWNPYWGEKGYFRIKKGGNECGIEDQVTASSATAKWGKKSDVTV